MPAIPRRGADHAPRPSPQRRRFYCLGLRRESASFTASVRSVPLVPSCPARHIVDLLVHQRERGRYLGGRRPFGYRIGPGRTLIEVPSEQEAIAKIFGLRRAGLSQSKIATETVRDGLADSQVGVGNVLRLYEDKFGASSALAACGRNRSPAFSSMTNHRRNGGIFGRRRNQRRRSGRSTKSSIRTNGGWKGESESESAQSFQSERKRRGRYRKAGCARRASSRSSRRRIARP